MKKVSDLPLSVQRALDKLSLPRRAGELLVAEVTPDGEVGWRAYDPETGEGSDVTDEIDSAIGND